MRIFKVLLVLFTALHIVGCDPAATGPDATTVQPSNQDLNRAKLEHALSS